MWQLQLQRANLSTKGVKFARIVEVSWRGDRVVEGTGLENQRAVTYRGFESLSLRQAKR